MALLDKDGLSYFWSKIKTKLNGKSDTGHTHAISDITDLQTNLDNRVTFDKQGNDTMQIQWYGNDWNKSDVGYVACWKQKDGTLIHTVPVSQFANASHSHDLLTEVKNVSFNVTMTATDKVVKFTLPNIDTIGKICVYQITSGSIYNNGGAWRYFTIGINLPTSGSYKILNQSGIVKATYTNTTTTLNLAEQLEQPYYDSYRCEVAKGQSATVSGNGCIVLMRLA